MRKLAAALAGVGLLVSGCNDTITGTRVEAAPTTTTTEAPVTPSAAMGGYAPVSDVGQHAKLSLDLCDVNAALDAANFAAATAVYRDGKNSAEGAGKRTLGNFATESRELEDTLGRYQRYLGASWLDAFVSAALNGTGPFAGESEAVRRQAVQKGARDQIVVAWVLHELDAALQKAAKASYTKASGAPHNWDEVWAYYHGEKPECSPFATAQASEEQFGVGTLITRRLQLFAKDGLKATVDKKASAVRSARDQIVRDITISYVQSVISAASKIDAALAAGKADEARVTQARGWAYYRVIEPLIAKVNTTSAETIHGVFDLAAKPAAGSVAKVTAAFASAYGPFGIAPADVGELPGNRAAAEAPAAGEDEGPDNEPEDGE
jgi:hypothetical protein